MKKPVEPSKEIEKRVSFSCDDNMGSILKAYEQIKDLYPRVFDSSIKYDYYDRELNVFVRVENPLFQEETEQYNKDMIKYLEYQAQKEIKKQAEISKKEMNDKRRAARIAANQSKPIIDNSVVVIDNKKYRVSLVED